MDDVQMDLSELTMTDAELGKVFGGQEEAGMSARCAEIADLSDA